MLPGPIGRKGQLRQGERRECSLSLGVDASGSGAEVAKHEKTPRRYIHGRGVLVATVGLNRRVQRI